MILQAKRFVLQLTLFDNLHKRPQYCYCGLLLFYKVIMKIYIYIIVVLCSYVFGFSQQIQTKWEYFHFATKAIVDFNHGKKILAYPNRDNVYFVLERSDSVPMFVCLDSTGLLKYSYLYIYNLISDGNFNRTTRLSNYNRYAFDFVLNEYPRIANLWYDTSKTILGAYFFWYIDSTKSIFQNGQRAYDSTSKNDYNTISTDGRNISLHFYIDSSNNIIISDSTYIITRVRRTLTFGRINKVFDSVSTFSYKTANFKQIPYPKASKYRDTTSNFILQSPDTIFNENTDIAIRLVKHKQDFVQDSVYIPTPSMFLNAIPNQQTFAPKVFSVAYSGYALTGNVHDANGNTHALLYRSRYDGTNEASTVTSSKVDISSCKIREDGTVVAVGKKYFPEDPWKNEDFFLAIWRPGTSTVEEYTWGTAFNDLIYDVCFLKDGDIVVSGNAGVNCYVARIATDNPTSVGESVPFSSTIGFAPNPASSQTLVRFAPTTDGIATAELYDMRGMKVKQLFSEPVQRGNEYTFPAPVSDVPNGVYTVIITNGITKHHQQLQIIR